MSFQQASRRDFLLLLAAGLGAPPLSRLLLAGQGGNSAPPAFEEIPPSASKITWRHTAGLSPQMYLPETEGPGAAFLDYDNDGWMDIYLVNSGPCDFFQPAQPLRNALYRNNRDGTFTDVTAKAGVAGNAYGMGVAVGDFDNDGLPDLYVTQYPRSILYHNNGDGTFTDVTAKAGVAAPGWATSAVWFDYDNDGRLDLFVCRFVEFSRAANKPCGTPDLRIYCMPTVYPPAASWLFHNNGDGTFTDVSKETGIARALGKAWGVVAADVNNDGWQDLFVANDKVANFLFLNRKGKFTESGALAGVAYNVMGLARSGMGVDAADYNNDGWLDLFVSNVDHETYSLYRNNKDETFDDVSPATGLAAATRLLSGWGLKFFDYDNDGNLDLLLANGHPDTMVGRRMPELSYAEPLLLFRNEGPAWRSANTGKERVPHPERSEGWVWRNVSAESGPVFQKNLAARALALGDFDNDGSVDALITVNDAAPILLRNNAGRQNHWLGLRLVGTKANRDAVGAKITYQAGDLQRTVWKVGGGSYLASHDPRVVLGLGQRTKVDWVEVQWPQPSGKVERFTELPINKYLTITEGEGKWK